MPEFTALQSITAPGSFAIGYHKGDPISADVIERWALTEDVDYVAGGVEAAEAAAAAPQRPSPEDNRAAWETWAVANGMPATEASVAAIEDLQADRDADGEEIDRPAESAKKADWVEYAVARGLDEQTAKDSTIPQLQDFDYDTLR